MTDNVYSEVRELRTQIDELRSDMRDIRRALLGDDYDGNGLTQVVGQVVNRERSMQAELHAIRDDQKRRRQVAKQQQLAAGVAAVAVLVLAWLLSTLLIVELRQGVGIGPAEARFIATILLAVLVLAGGFAGATLGVMNGD